MQSAILAYVEELGVLAEVGLCVEYLGVNKEQRLYMRWVEEMSELALRFKTE